MKTAKLIIEGKEITVSIDEAELKKLEEKKGRWRADIDGAYFYLNYRGAPARTDELNTKSDDWNYLTKNYFETNQQAEFYKVFLQAISEIKQYIVENGMEFVPDWKDRSQKKYNIAFDDKLECFVDDEWVFQGFNFFPCVLSKENCDQIIRDCHKQLEVIREYTKHNNY